MEILKQRVMKYFKTLDDSLEKLSHKNEGEITGLPSWTLTTNAYWIGYTSDHKKYVLKVLPNILAEKSSIDTMEINSDEVLDEFLSPMDGIKRISLKEFQAINEDHFEEIGGLIVMPEDENPLGHAESVDFLLAFGSKQNLEKWLNPENAKKEALEYWNNRHYWNNPTEKKNYILETKKVLEKLSAIIKRKSWLERKIHRYINTHRYLLLPSHKNCFYEHKLYSEDGVRKADFILQREDGLPSLLIELESPVHKVFTKKGELMQTIRHAIFQIEEWDWIIQTNSKENASGKFKFLLGKKDHLVIAGRSTDRKSTILDKKYGNTTVWSYDDFIEQARDRLNGSYISQCQILGIDEIAPF